MNTIILGGFLGSGKTTVLMQLARYLTEHAGRNGTPVVILENEISKYGIDNQLLSRSNYTVENLFAGCICCRSSAKLCESVLEIRKTYHPQWLIVEATGLAYPENILHTIRDELHLDACIIAIVDLKRWKKVSAALGQFVSSQLHSASVVMLTKIDLVTAQVIDSTRNDICELAPNAAIFPVCATDRQPDSFWEKVLQFTRMEV